MTTIDDSSSSDRTVRDLEPPFGHRWFWLCAGAQHKAHVALGSSSAHEQHAEEATMWHELRELDQLALAAMVGAADQRDGVHARGR